MTARAFGLVAGPGTGAVLIATLSKESIGKDSSPTDDVLHVYIVRSLLISGLLPSRWHCN